MNFNKLLLGFILIVGLASCVSKKDIIGTYTSKHHSYYGKVTINNDGTFHHYIADGMLGDSTHTSTWKRKGSKITVIGTQKEVVNSNLVTEQQHDNDSSIILHLVLKDDIDIADVNIEIIGKQESKTFILTIEKEYTLILPKADGLKKIQQILIESAYVNRIYYTPKHNKSNYFQIDLEANTYLPEIYFSQKWRFKKQYIYPIPDDKKKIKKGLIDKYLKE